MNCNRSKKRIMKSLDQFISFLALARNQPLENGDLDLISFLLEAKQKGIKALNYNLPFVRKVIMSYKAPILV